MFEIIKITWKGQCVEPLTKVDPIWEMVGIAESKELDIAENHDFYLAEGEIERWKSLRAEA